MLLRPVCQSYFDAYFKLAFDKRIWQYYPFEITTIDELQGWLIDCISDRNACNRAAFSILDKDSGEIAGSSCYGNISYRDRRLEIGWSWINPRFQRTGINRHAKFLLLEYAFEVLGMARVEFKTDVLNEKARKALLGIGCTEEGVLRSHTLMPKGRRRDTIFYSLLRDEWPATKAAVFAGYQSLASENG
ncbi:MAG: GNAT family protein [Planctomycetota bacterium]